MSAVRPALLVRAEHDALSGLPDRLGQLGRAWTSGRFAVVAPTRAPEALAALQRALPVGARVEFWLTNAVISTTAGADTDTEADRSTVAAPARAEPTPRSRASAPAPGGTGPASPVGPAPPRRSVGWSPTLLADVVRGAGFELDRLLDGVIQGRQAISAPALRARTLPDRVGKGLRMLVCGLNPSLYAADAGIGFARPGNRFWPAALAAGVATRDRDPEWLLSVDSVGMTDLVKRATVGADELAKTEYEAGVARLDRLVRWLRPGVVCFVGLAGWRAAVDRRACAGPQPGGFGGRPAYLMPNTSGLNAHTSVAELTDHLRAAASLARPRR